MALPRGRYYGNQALARLHIRALHHPFFMQRTIASIALLVFSLGLSLNISGVEATKGKDTLVPAAKPASDAGAKDPADFPRPPGLVRLTYSQAPGKLRDEEIATYHAPAGMDEVAGTYLARLQTANWKKGSDAVSGTDIHRVRIIEWTMPGKEAEVRFYALKGSGSDVRVRTFTYKTATQAGVADAGPAATKPAQAAAGNATAKSKATGAAPLGPPPTNFKISSLNPYVHNLSWTIEEVTTCDVFRVDSTGRTQVADKIESRSMTDLAYLEPNTIYHVVVHYHDGRDGSLDYTYANPPQPGVVANLKAVQIGPGKVKLTWDREHPMVNGVGWGETYQVTSPTSAVFNQRLNTNSLEVASVPAGNHWVRVAMVYGDPGKMAPAPKDVSVNFDMLTDRGRYRIVFLGVECVHETADDPLQLDGKHDELYAGAYTVRVTRESTNAPAPDGSFIRTKVMGDTNGFPDRLQAGTASDKGGIQTGDFVPSSACTAAQPRVAATDDRFPLLVWEGELLDSSDLLVIAPVLFSWNKGGDKQWDYWKQWWATPNNAAQVRDMARKGARPDKFASNLSWEWQRDRWAGGIIDPVTTALDRLDPDRKRRNGPSFTLDADRPIGLEDQHSGGVMNVPYLVWDPHGLVLTRANIEAALGKQDTVITQWGCFDMDKYDTTTNADMKGDYTLFIQIERLPEMKKALRP